MQQRPVYIGQLAQLVVGCVVVASLFVVSACTHRLAGEPSPAPRVDSTTSSGSGGAAGRSGQALGESPSPASSEESTTVNGGAGPGPGGAPWDPCRIITWDDLPDEKPTNEAEPERQVAPPDAAFTAACRFAAVSNDIGVLWGPSSKATVVPSGRHGEERTTIAGRPGLKIVGLSEGLTLTCTAKVDLGTQFGDDRGVAEVGVFARTKDPELDKHPCVVALRLAAEIVKRTR